MLAKKSLTFLDGTSKSTQFCVLKVTHTTGLATKPCVASLTYFCPFVFFAILMVNSLIL